MDAFREKYGLSSNLGLTDRIARYLMGIVLLGGLLILNMTMPADWSVGWLVLLPLCSIPIVVSAIMRWDPVYAVLRISSV